MDDVRWKQRFNQFEKAYLEFIASLEDEKFNSFSVRERKGVIQEFEILIELTWKLLKDYLEFNGIVFKTVFPKQVMREAFSANLLKDGEVWAEMLELRNKLSHTYDQQVFDEAMDIFQEAFKAPFVDLYKFFRSRPAT